MTYPSPDFPQITLQPGIFTPPGVLAAIEDPDQTAGAQPRCKESGFFQVTWVPGCTILEIQGLKHLKDSFKCDYPQKYAEKMTSRIWFLRSFLLMSSNPITETYNKKVASFWISCDGPCGILWSQPYKKETQVRKQAVHMTQEKSLKVFRSKILQAATCTSYYDLSLFFWVRKSSYMFIIPYQLVRLYELYQVRSACFSTVWHILRRGLGNVANLWQHAWEAIKFRKRLGEMDIFSIFKVIFLTSFWYLEVFCVTQCFFV